MKTIAEIGKELNLSQKTINKVEEIYIRYKKDYDGFYFSNSMMSGLFYVVCYLMGEKKTQNEISHSNNVSTISIRYHFPRFIKYLTEDEKIKMKNLVNRKGRK